MAVKVEPQEDGHLGNLEKDLEMAYDAVADDYGGEDAQPTGYSGPGTTTSSFCEDSFPATQPSSSPSSPAMPAPESTAVPNPVASQALEADAPLLVSSGPAALPAKPGHASREWKRSPQA